MAVIHGAQWTTSATTSITVDNWAAWNQNLCFNSSGTWQTWNSTADWTTSSSTIDVYSGSRLRAQFKPPSAEDLEHERLALLEQTRIATERKVVVEAARTTAQALLEAHLTPAQRLELSTHRYFTVEGQGSKRRYRVWAGKGKHGNIEELDAKGVKVASLCCAPQAEMPEADALLSQKLFLELDEEAFRKTANIRLVG